MTYEYSKSGQIAARTANGVRQTYEYDKKGQLLAVKDADGNAVERYAYDKAGNMLKKTLRIGRGDSPSRPQYQTTTFAFDAANQLVSSTTDGVTTRYTYDAAGRMVREGNKTYRYGYLDKVMSVSDGDTTRTFTYHADGQLARANYGDSSESFAWDGLALIQRGDEQFINEPHIGGGNPVASSKGTSYFNDALGTTVGSKSNGKYSAAALTAFGEGTDADKAVFTGKPMVEGLGHAFLMRNYRAGLAKWQTADLLGYPDGWNQLAYCKNRCITDIDAFGTVDICLIDDGFTSKEDKIIKEGSKNYNRDDRITVSGHGCNDGPQDSYQTLIDVLDIANQIKNLDKFKNKALPVELDMCYVGNGQWAQQLANELKVDVYAATGIVRFWEDGRVMPLSPWKKFSPE